VNSRFDLICHGRSQHAESTSHFRQGPKTLQIWKSLESWKSARCENAFVFGNVHNGWVQGVFIKRGKTVEDVAMIGQVQSTIISNIIFRIRMVPIRGYSAREIVFAPESPRQIQLAPPFFTHLSVWTLLQNQCMNTLENMNLLQCPDFHFDVNLREYFYVTKHVNSGCCVPTPSVLEQRNCQTYA
jgi:hypothetical protein